MEENDIIIIRGAPGVGKSTTAKLLAEMFPKGVRLEVDTLRNMVISPDWKNQKEHIDLLNVSLKVVLEFLSLGFRPVIVVDTFSGNKIEKYLNDFFRERPEKSVLIFSLHCSEGELRSRVENRNEDEFKDFDVCRKLNRELNRHNHQNETHLDTTRLTLEEVVYTLYTITTKPLS